MYKLKAQAVRDVMGKLSDEEAFTVALCMAVAARTLPTKESLVSADIGIRCVERTLELRREAGLDEDPAALEALKQGRAMLSLAELLGKVSGEYDAKPEG